MFTEILPVTEQELPVVRSLAHEIWHEHYPSIISIEQVEYMLEKMYSLEALKEQLAKGDHFFIAASEGKNAGFISFSDEERNTHINKLYTLKAVRGKGFGKMLLEVAEKARPQPLTLYVNRKNIEAINFYFKAGFTIEKAVDLPIGNGYYMNDFFMRKGISNA